MNLISIILIIIIIMFFFFVIYLKILCKFLPWSESAMLFPTAYSFYQESDTKQKYDCQDNEEPCPKWDSILWFTCNFEAIGTAFTILLFSACSDIWVLHPTSIWTFLYITTLKCFFNSNITIATLIQVVIWCSTAWKLLLGHN